MIDNVAIARQLATVLAVVFAIGAAVIALGTLTGRAPRRLWVIYFSEILVLALIVIPAYVGRLALLPVLTLLAFVCTREIANVLRSAGHQPALIPLFVIGGAAVLSAALFPGSAHHAVLAASPFALLAAALLARGDATVTSRVGANLLIFVFPILGVAELGALALRSDGFGQVIWMYGVVELGDAGALVFGSVFGKRKIWPRLSPKKTIVGSVAGLLCAVAGAIALGFAVPQFSMLRCAVWGGALAVIGQLADLVASAIKREAGVKDFSNVVPAQGGVLDVYDSLLLVAPVHLCFLQLFDP